MKRVVVAIALVGMAALLGFDLTRDAPAAPVTPKAPTYETTVAEVAKERRRSQVMADAEPGSWSRRAHVAAQHLAYAQLTGDYDAYLAAEKSLAEAFRVARSSIDDDAVGPLLLKAQLSYELHRLQPALEALRVPERHAEYFGDRPLLAQIISLRGAITFQLGRYDEGIALLKRAIAIDPKPEHEQRLALSLAHVGEDREAERLLERTERHTSGRSRAWLELQRGLLDLDRGKRADARAHFEKACALFPGYWQAEERLAELDAEEGRKEQAITAYRSLIERTGDPEFMDALAELVDPAEESRLRKRSNELYDKRLRTLPESTYGHALEHFLMLDPNAQRAVTIAEKNRDLRPNGEARTRLAQAYFRAGRVADARAEIQRVLDSKWRSAESFATAAVILRHAGDARAARAAADKAVAINPHALEESAWLEDHLSSK